MPKGGLGMILTGRVENGRARILTPCEYEFTLEILLCMGIDFHNIDEFIRRLCDGTEKV